MFGSCRGAFFGENGAHKPRALSIQQQFRFEISEIYKPNGSVHSGCTDPTQATVRLVIVLVTRIQGSSTGNNNFVKWRGTSLSYRPKWPDRWKRTTFKTGPECSGQTKSKRSVPFDVPSEHFGIVFWVEWKAPQRISLILGFQKKKTVSGMDVRLFFI